MGYQSNIKIESLTMPIDVLKGKKLSDAFSSTVLSESLTELNLIEGTATEIPEYLCRTYTKLNKVTLPNNITKINTMTFSDCTSLANIYLPESLTILGSINE